MRFLDNGASAGQCRSGIAAARGKSQWKIAGPKNHDRPHRDIHPPDIVAWQRLAIRQRVINPRINP